MSSYAMQIMTPKHSIYFFLVLFRPSYANGRQAMEIVGLPAQQNGPSGTVIGWPYFCVGPKNPLPKLVANSDGFGRNLPMQVTRTTSLYSGSRTLPAPFIAKAYISCQEYSKIKLFLWFCKFWDGRNLKKEKDILRAIDHTCGYSGNLGDERSDAPERVLARAWTGALHRGQPWVWRSDRLRHGPLGRHRSDVLDTAHSRHNTKSGNYYNQRGRWLSTLESCKKAWIRVYSGWCMTLTDIKLREKMCYDGAFN